MHGPGDPGLARERERAWRDGIEVDRGWHMGKEIWKDGSMRRGGKTKEGLNPRMPAVDGKGISRIGAESEAPEERMSLSEAKRRAGRLMESMPRERRGALGNAGLKQGEGRNETGRPE